MKTLTILMSTYNGEQYISGQLRSIAEQRGIEDIRVDLLIRDDGSSDQTVNIINMWKNKLNIKLIKGMNIGARKSFLYLFKNAPVSDYYAFCDQDDIWYQDKLQRALSKINEKTLYFSNIAYIDSNGESTGNLLLRHDFQVSLKRILMCNPANGCSMVWDYKLHECARNISTDTFTMHDEYLCTVAYLFGNVIYDYFPGMGYRVHGENVTQSNNFRKKIILWKKIWFGRKPYSLDKRAKMLLGYRLRDDDKKILTDLSIYKKGFKRWNLVWTYSCEEPAIERSFRLRMLLGLL